MAYAGPGDVVASPVEFWGLRAVSSAYAAAGTNKLIRVQRSSDSAQTDVLVSGDANNGGFGNVSAGGSLSAWAGADTITIAKWYGQAGGINLVPTANMATLQPTAFKSGTLPGAFFVKTAPDVYTLDASLPATAAPATISAVAKRTGSFSTNGTIAYWGATGFTWLFFWDTTNAVIAFDGTNLVSAAATDNLPHSIQAVVNGASSIINADGTTGSGTLTNFSDGSAFFLGETNSSTERLDGYIQEVGLWGSAFSSGQQASMIANQTNYWIAAITAPAKVSLPLLGVGALAWAGNKIAENKITPRRRFLTARW